MLYIIKIVLLSKLPLIYIKSKKKKKKKKRKKTNKHITCYLVKFFLWVYKNGFNLKSLPI